MAKLDTEDNAIIAQILLGADAKDWERLEQHLAKDASGTGRFWQDTMKMVRAAIEEAQKS